ncbi:unnamed protein product [Mycena citricolor]|uniref:Pentatricopeptide repeat-containing protein n=1 Tax=Mycena citricolor TaxID=2018698 RepID=A0AAD2K307_9AGAR|nr:unnamed protein product [Mycena citricolor]CAK5274524.1 unnamed protein product [Mycena citricolor]
MRPALIRWRTLTPTRLLSTVIEKTVLPPNELLALCIENNQLNRAERIRKRLAKQSLAIIPNALYEGAALEQIRFHGKQSVREFLAWIRLVPDNLQPECVRDVPLTRTRDLLLHTGAPARNLHLITLFSLVCAEKGYGALVWDDLVRLMTGYQHPDKAVSFFLEYEKALVAYYTRYQPSRAAEISRKQRHLLVQLCCDAGWLAEAAGVVRDSPGMRLTRSCERLVGLLQGQEELSEEMAVIQRHLRRHRAPKPLSTGAIVKGVTAPMPREWMATELREVKAALSNRSLAMDESPGNSLHSFMVNYRASQGHPRGLTILRNRAVSLSDGASYVWLCKEMFFLRESRRFADTVTLFNDNFDSTFLPAAAWHPLLQHASSLSRNPPLAKVPSRLAITPADAWIIWHALIRLSARLESPLNILRTLHYSAAHYSSQLSRQQFCAYPTSYVAVFRSLVAAYGRLGRVEDAIAAAGDVLVIKQLHPSNVGIADELAGVHARCGDIQAANRMLDGLEALGPRPASYGLIMDAYLDKGLTEEAFKLESRMMKKIRYIPGKNWRLDKTLTRLEASR